LELINGIRTLNMAVGDTTGTVKIIFIVKSWDDIPPIIESQMIGGEFFTALLIERNLKAFSSKLPYFKVTAPPELQSAAEALCDEIEKFMTKRKSMKRIKHFVQKGD